MRIGIPREIMDHENRVGIVPAGVDVLVRGGHSVLVQAGAGQGSGISDEDYTKAGAKVVSDAVSIWGEAEMILKVKEPLPPEYGLVRPGLVIFTYFHFAAYKALTEAMLEKKAACIAYETIQREDRSLPLLTPMSEIAGRMAVQEGAKYLEKPMMGRGILLGGVPGVAPARVVILGGGIVGTNAAKVAAGLGSWVSILDTNLDRLRYLSDIMPPNVHTIYSTPYAIQEAVREADLLIGAVLRSGAKAPKLVPRGYLSLMKPGAVIVDVAVDQGGCVETTRPTTHSNPTFIVDGIVHYCVANMPGAVGRTSTHALTNATLPYAVELAGKGWRRAVRENREIARGVNVVDGRITHEAVAEAWNREYTPLDKVLAA